MLLPRVSRLIPRPCLLCPVQDEEDENGGPWRGGGVYIPTLASCTMDVSAEDRLAEKMLCASSPHATWAVSSMRSCMMMAGKTVPPSAALLVYGLR